MTTNVIYDTYPRWQTSFTRPQVGCLQGRVPPVCEKGFTWHFGSSRNVRGDGSKGWLQLFSRLLLPPSLMVFVSDYYLVFASRLPFISKSLFHTGLQYLNNPFSFVVVVVSFFQTFVWMTTLLRPYTVWSFLWIDESLESHFLIFHLFFCTF